MRVLLSSGRPDRTSGLIRTDQPGHLLSSNQTRTDVRSGQTDESGRHVSRRSRPTGQRHFVVLVKQVPKDHHFEVNYETGRVRRQHVELATNPDDLHALEATLRLREQYGGTVTAVTMGPPQAAASLREVLATGADRGVLLCDERFAGADTLLTSRVLCAALKKLEPYDVVAAGCHSVDGNTGQVPVQVSQRAKIPLVKKVREMKLTGDAFWAKRNFGHEFQEITAPLPVMLGVDKYWNKPRIPTLAGIRRAYGKELSTWDAEELGFGLNFNCARDSPTRVLRVFPLRHARKNEVISGTVDQQVARVCEVLAAENVLVKRVRE